MTDEPTIQPALTPQQWATLLGGPGLVYLGGGGDLYRDNDGTLRVGPNGQDAWLTTADRAMVAALCLYGQPFGFTQEDTDTVRAVTESIQDLRSGRISQEQFAMEVSELRSRLQALWFRIAALLPPARP